MQRRGLSQEALKGIACITMLLDHIGIIFVLEHVQNATGADKSFLRDVYETLRIIGRISFPIYCFLLVEGIFHTHDPKRYGLRLLICAVLAEIPYDLVFYGMVTWKKQSVMVTLLLGLLMLEVMKRCPNLLLRLLVTIPFAYLAQQLPMDYGAKGILVIALFALTREMPHKMLLHFLGLWCIFSANDMLARNWQKLFSVAIQDWATLAAIPIALYDGRKVTKNKLVQWAFYLFYPAHLVALYLIQAM